MKKVLMVVLSLALMAGVSAQNSSEVVKGKTLVAYFSVSGNTKKVAQSLSESIGADLFEIQAEQPYTTADVDYRNRESRSVKEMGDKSIRPVIASKVENMGQYETVLIGFPVWGNLAPNIIYSFIDGYDFSGKTVRPFVTSGSSPIDNSANALKAKYPDIKWAKGMRFSGEFDKTVVDSWLK